jgi:hypothetical protein
MTGHKDVRTAKIRQQAAFERSEHLNMTVAPDSFQTGGSRTTVLPYSAPI